MTKNRIIVLAASIACFLPWAANAQSPWESGTYNNYAPKAAGDQPTSGLEGYSLSPTQAPTPASPAVQPSPKGTVSTAAAPVSNSNARSQASEARHRAAVANDSATITITLQTGAGVLMTSEVANGKSQSQDVKALATKIVATYKPIQIGLHNLAKKAKIAIIKSAVVPNKATLSKLSAAKADSFDSLYLKDVQRDLGQLHYLFTKQASNIHNADLKAYVASKAATVQKLEDEVKTLSKSYPSPAVKAAQQAQQQTQQAQQPRLPGTIPSFTTSAPH